MNRININDSNILDKLEKEKEYIKLIHKMEDGEITEDEFKEECEKINNFLNNRGKKQMVDIDVKNRSAEKEKKESYSEYFSKNKNEFKNILGI